MGKTIKPLPWDEVTGQTVRIYRNLNNGTMSIQIKGPKSWKVAGHITNAVVQDVAFRVSDAGRQRVLRDQRKNVHAWGQGILIGKASEVYCPIALGYDPYNDENFIDKDTRRIITRADWLVVRDNIVYVSPDALGSPSTQKAIALPTRDRGVRVQPTAISTVVNWIAA